jgi:hypothetical protein
MKLIEILFKHESRFINSRNEMRHNARICMLTEVGSSRKLEPTEDAGEAVLEL